MKEFNCTSCGQGLLIKALEAVVPTLCPVCGPAYALAKNVSKVEALPPNITGLAGAVCVLLLGFAGAKIIDDLFFS